jgi:hypothetical protein
MWYVYYHLKWAAEGDVIITKKIDRGKFDVVHNKDPILDKC